MLSTNRTTQMASALFPQKEKPKKRYGYKSRGQAHTVRKVNVSKDPKDVRFKPAGTDNNRPETLAARRNQIPSVAQTQPRNTSKSARTRAKQAAPSTQNSRSKSQNSDPNFVTLTNEQFDKLLGLVGKSGSGTPANLDAGEEDLVSKMVGDIHTAVQAIEVPAVVPVPVEAPREVVEVRPVQAVAAVVETGLIGGGDSARGQRSRPASGNSKRKDSLGQHATQSVFQIGGDGAPQVESFAEAKRRQKREWLADLEQQREQQRKAKNAEKEAQKDLSRIEPTWQYSEAQVHRPVIKTVNNFSKTSQDMASAMQQSNSTSYNFSQQQQQNTTPQPVLQPTVEKVAIPVVENTVKAAPVLQKVQDQKSQSSGRTSGFSWNQPVDDNQERLAKIAKQKEILKEQIEQRERVRQEKKQREEAEMKREEERVKLELEIMNKRYLVESHKSPVDSNYQVSIANGLKKALSPRQETPTSAPPAPLAQPVSHVRSSTELTNSVSVSNLDPVRKKTELQLPAEILQNLKPDPGTGKIRLDVDFDEMQIQQLQAFVEEKVSARMEAQWNAQDRNKTDSPGGQGKTGGHVNDNRSVGKQTKKAAKKSNEPRKWGAAAPKSTYVPMSERQGNNTERQRRLKERQEKLLADQARNAERIARVTKPRKSSPRHTQRGGNTGATSGPSDTQIPVRRTENRIIERPLTKNGSDVYQNNRSNNNPRAPDRQQPDNSLSGDIAKSRDRQQKILKEINALRQGILQKRAQLDYLE